MVQILGHKFYAKNINYKSKFYFISDSQERKFHKEVFVSYYQWISVILVIQAFSFYIPKLIWMTVNGKKLDPDFKNSNLDGKDERENRIKEWANYLKQTRGSNNKSGLTHVFCKLSYLVQF